ncbi:MAG: hypothetical protein IJE40_07055 [Clostridia bacterium]|nr:hypothetical protein [Clostridia bacterium]
MSICFIAHRGYSGKYLQNTEEAFLKAVEHGSGGIETDVRITKDGYLVVNHDDFAHYEDGTDLEIETSTYADLSAKPLKNPFTDTKLYICTFKRYLEICRDGNMVCFIEFKGAFPDEKIVEAFNLAKEIYDLKMCSLQSFDMDTLIRTRKIFPELQIMVTCGRLSEKIDRCIEYGFDIDIANDVVTAEIVKRFHDKGLKVAIWTADNEEDLKYCISINPDYIESDVYANEKGE